MSGINFRSFSRTPEFDGFLRIYWEQGVMPNLGGKSNTLPNLKPDEQVAFARLVLMEDSIILKPFSVWILLQKLASLGVVRPSTVARVFRNIKDCGYVTFESTGIVPTQKAKTLVNFLAREYPFVFDVDFIKGIEDGLDEVAVGKGGWTDLARGVHEKMNFLDPSTIRGPQKKIGNCPLCGWDVVQWPDNFRCTNYKFDGCKFIIWKKCFGGTIGVNVVIEILNSPSLMSTEKLQFISKKGDPYEARVKYCTITEKLRLLLVPR